MRYERKYRITNVDLPSVVHTLELHPSSFTKHFPDRQVNSIYYDDSSFSNVQSNLSGISHRSKYRIRWYGLDLETVRGPVLEKKIKENQLGYKEYDALNDFNLNSDLYHISRHEQLLNLNLFPVVSVHYKRSYYLSFHKRIRVTIDRDIQFRQIQNYAMSKSMIVDPAIVLEIKYDEADSVEANQILNTLPFRISKNSKYVSAVESVWF